MRKARFLTTAELNRIIARFDTGQGVTAAVQAFAQAVPVAERTVWYWLGGRKVHPAMAERIRSLKPPKRKAARSRSKPSKHKPTGHEYGDIQSAPVRPFLESACDKLTKRMGDKIKADYRKMLQQQAANEILRDAKKPRA